VSDTLFKHDLTNELIPFKNFEGCCQTKSNRYQSTTITQIYEAQI